MRSLILLLLVVCSISRLTAQSQRNEENEAELIRQTIQTAYVEGLQNEGDTVKINKGFHPGFELLIPDTTGGLKKYTLPEWKANIKGDLASGKLPRKEGSRISVRFLQVDVTGDAAMAKFEFYVGQKLTFIDYQFLYKFGDQWKIVSKIFHKF